MQARDCGYCDRGRLQGWQSLQDWRPRRDWLLCARLPGEISPIRLMPHIVQGIIRGFNWNLPTGHLMVLGQARIWFPTISGLYLEHSLKCGMQ